MTTNVLRIWTHWLCYSRGMLASPRSLIRSLRVPFTFAAVELFRMMQLLRLPDGRMVCGMNDDAFYYLQLARNFAASGRWSFDRVEPATGFHLLWAYLLAAIYWFDPGIGLHALYLVTEIFQIACLTVACAFAVRTAVRLFGPAAEAGVAVIFLSTLSLVNGGLLMEAPLAILLTAVVWDQFMSARPRLRAAFFLLGMAGVFARLDFALLPAVLLLVSLVLRRRDKVRLAATILAGSVGGVGLVAVHTHWISGSWLQSSGRVKLFWSSFEGYSTAPVRQLLLEYFNSSLYAPWTPPRGVHGAAVLLALWLLIAAAWGMWRARGDRIAIATLLAVIAAYVWLYRFDSAGIQIWYVAGFQIPVAILVGYGFTWLRSRRVALGLGVGLCVWGVAGSYRVPADTDSPLYAAGIYLRNHPGLKPAGSFNAGMIAYFAGGGVTNLDGLVNDRIYPYAVAGNLLGYVRERDLRTLADFHSMFEPSPDDPGFLPMVNRRGGYTDGRLLGCLMRETNLGDTAIYRVKKDCP